MANKANDYLAVISTAGGIGSWARYPDREKAIKAVARLFKSDYRGVFKLPKGTEVTIHVVDVTGHNSIWWDANYFYDGDIDDNEPHRLNRPVEKVKHTSDKNRPGEISDDPPGQPTQKGRLVMSKQEITTKLAATEASLKRWQTRLKRAAKMVHDLDRKRRRYQLMLLSEGQPVIATVKVKNGKVESPLPELVQAIDNRLTAIIEDRPALDMPAFLDRSDPLIAEKMTAARKAAEAEARKAMPLSGRAAALAIKLAKKKKA